MSHDLGLVIGKFLPPHRGHKLLIDTATTQCERVVVIVCAKPDDFVAGEQRADWLREIHPRCQVMVIDDRYDANDSRVWADNTLRWLGRAPAAVFSSEDYGDRYAALMGARHVSVDQPRRAVPISATLVRADPFANWAFLEPPVRAWFCRRVCIVGAESTGTTTLAEDLAARLHTIWVPEYGRNHSARKVATGDTEWRSEEFVAIATQQNRLEEAAARRADRVLVCDTNALATTLWHRRYVGTDSDQVAAVARRSRCDLYLLTGDEIPFVEDGLRDGEHLRHTMHGWFESMLAGQAVPWHTVRGTRPQRLATALELVRGLFAGSHWRPAD